MGKKQNITQYRERLDRTLASPKLTNLESLKTLVKNQILQSSGQEAEGCSEKVIEKRTAEVSNFLDMLRSVSVNDNEGSKTHDTTSDPEWKVKQDNEEFRVMYREGPEGTPYHTLLVEGYVDGPLDVCLCISWESALYKKWWPQSTIPTFKILACNCLQKVRINEQISLIRLKVSWPLSTREAVVHYFLFEYFEDDLLIVILNSVSDTGSIKINTHGFTNEAIPEPKDVVRIDVVGGFALQKVTTERSYFRTIANMDIKLDFVPPSLINFISRQLIGNGFRLYQKAVASMFTCDEDFSKALRDSLYARIQEALYSTNQSKGSLEEKELCNDASNLPEEHETTNNLAELEVIDQKVEITNNLIDLEVMDQKVHFESNVVESPFEVEQVTGGTTFCEIEELMSEESKHFDDQISVEKVTEKSPVNGKRNIIIRSEVKQALGTLEKVISMVREHGFNTQTPSWFTSERTPKENDANENDADPSSEDERVCSNVEVHIENENNAAERTASQESVKNGSVTQNSRNEGSNSFSREANHNRIAPASPEQKISFPCDTNTNQVAFVSVKNGSTDIPILNHTMENNKHLNGEISGVCETGINGQKKPRKKRNHWSCCFGMIS